MWSNKSVPKHLGKIIGEGRGAIPKENSLNLPQPEREKNQKKNGG